MKRMIFIQTVPSLKEKSLHIRLDGTVGIVSVRKKPSAVSQFVQRVQAAIAFIFAPVP